MHKKYDAAIFLDTGYKCNLNCGYCFINKEMREKSKLKNLDYSSMIKTLNNTGKRFKIQFCGGEPFLTPNFIEACREISKKHYIAIVTNLTNDKIKEFSEKINPEKVEYILASLHIKELEKTGLLKRYIENFALLKKKGFDIAANEVAYPALAEEVKKYTKFFKRENISFHFEPFRGEYKGKKYPAAYTEKEILVFGIKDRVKIFSQKGKLCNAGYNMLVASPNGDSKPCYYILNENCGNIYKKIKLKDKMIRCPIEFCGCPLNIHDKFLFDKAVNETIKTRNASLIDKILLLIKKRI